MIANLIKRFSCNKQRIPDDTSKNNEIEVMLRQLEGRFDWVEAYVTSLAHDLPALILCWETTLVVNVADCRSSIAIMLAML